MNRRAFLLACACSPCRPPSWLSSSAYHATGAGRPGLRCAILTLEELLDRSTYVVVGTAGERHSVWEDLSAGRRIVTYTKITVERAVSGAPDKELWVRTLGGVVDKIGQAVPGEVQLTAGARSLLFLAQVNGVVVVKSPTRA